MHWPTHRLRAAPLRKPSAPSDGRSGKRRSGLCQLKEKSGQHRVVEIPAIGLPESCTSQWMANIDNHITSPERKHGVTALEKLLQIDIPVNLSNVKMVFSIGALVFEGDLPASIFHLQLIENDAADWTAKSEVIGV